MCHRRLFFLPVALGTLAACLLLGGCRGPAPVISSSRHVVHRAEVQILYQPRPHPP